MDVLSRRTVELIALLAIGDGVAPLVTPRGHVFLWWGGPAWYQSMMSVLADRLTLLRLLSLGEVVLGLWVARRQYARNNENRRGGSNLVE